jgi:hypothetical protein
LRRAPLSADCGQPWPRKTIIAVRPLSLPGRTIRCAFLLFPGGMPLFRSSVRLGVQYYLLKKYVNTESAIPRFFSEWPCASWRKQAAYSQFMQ